MSCSECADSFVPIFSDQALHGSLPPPSLLLFTAIPMTLLSWDCVFLSQWLHGMGVLFKQFTVILASFSSSTSTQLFRSWS